MFHRVKAWSDRHLPKREELEQNRWIRPFAGHILRSELWRFTRRSVPRGAALGMFIGIFLMIPGLQIIGAAMFCLPFRGNVPIAIAMTFLSNPITTPAILLAALMVGNRVLGFHADMGALATLQSDGASLRDYVYWLLSDAAPAVISGLFVIALISAVVTYTVTALLWRAWVGHKWSQRLLERTIH